MESYKDNAFMEAFCKGYLKEDDIMKEQVRGMSRKSIETMAFSAEIECICFTCDCTGTIQTSGSYYSFLMDDLRGIYIVAEEWRKDN